MISPSDALRDKSREHRITGRGERPIAPQQSEIMRQRLAEAKARIDRRCARAAMPAASQAAARATRKSRTSVTTSSVDGRVLHRRRVALHVHQADAGVVAAAQASIAPGAVNAPMSLIIDAPAAIAARITAGLRVSTATAMPSPASAATSGITRASSPPSAHGAAPGRDDSPPMSIRSAPSSRHPPRVRERARADRDIGRRRRTNRA